MAVAERIKDHLKIGPFDDGKFYETDIEFQSMVPEVPQVEPPPLACDFSAVIAQTVGLDRAKWRIAELALCREVPNEVLHELYPTALMYVILRGGNLPNSLSGLAAQRIIVKCAAEAPELLVRYRYYLGLADDNGEFKTVTDDGADVGFMGLMDPYDRLFQVLDPRTGRSIHQHHGKQGVTVKGRKELQLYDSKGKSLRVLGFRWCLERLIPDEANPYRQFLEQAYANVRVPEFHSFRSSDNILLQVDRLICGLFRSANYLFGNDLAMPWARKNRTPFTLRLFRFAGYEMLAEKKMLSHAHDLFAEPSVGPEFF
jgi:hypothetical protein